VKNTTGKLLPGMTATVQFLTGDAQNVLIVPNAALRIRPTPAMLAQAQHAIGTNDDERASSAILWTLDNKGMLAPVRVHTGRSDETHTQVDGPGLTVGTAVVTGVLDAANRISDDAPSKNPFQSPRPSGGDKGG
jgi:HlyD family secretion protein